MECKSESCRKCFELPVLSIPRLDTTSTVHRADSDTHNTWDDRKQNEACYRTAAAEKDDPGIMRAAHRANRNQLRFADKHCNPIP